MKLAGDVGGSKILLALFIDCCGATACDHAPNVMAPGGVYIDSGIAPEVLPQPRVAGFAAAFDDKGSFPAQMRRMLGNPDHPGPNAIPMSDSGPTAIA